MARPPTQTRNDAQSNEFTFWRTGKVDYPDIKSKSCPNISVKVPGHYFIPAMGSLWYLDELNLVSKKNR